LTKYFAPTEGEEREMEAIAIRKRVIGVLLRGARTRAGKTQAECAEVLGCSPETISRYEYGQEGISLPELEALAIFLKVPITYFFGEDLPEEEKPPSSEALAIRRRIIGVLLRKARLEAGRSQEECADAIGCSSGKISEYEDGQSDIPLADLEALAEFLNVPITYFLEEDSIPSDEMKDELSKLPPDVREFVIKPENLPYLRVAMLLSNIPTDTLREICSQLL
jgi:transcriptional regulator with XRE-family HTH domain